MDIGLGKLNWYLNRLRCMSVPEVSHRIRRRVRTAFQQVGLGTAERTPAPRFTPVRSWLHRISPASPGDYVEAAERVLSGAVPILSREAVPVGTDPRWNRNPIGGQEVPLIFGKLIDYRDQELVGDVKYLWVLNRHAHLVTLAQAHCLTGDPRYLRAIGAQLRSWMTQCPYLRGPNWTSASELAMRLIRWGAVWHLIGGASAEIFRGEAGERLLADWLACIYRHVHFVRGNLSRFSSANNHLIGELAGVFIASATWPFWEDLRGWGESARDGLAVELVKQTGADGVSREQSLNYQRFVLEYALLAGLAGRATGIELPSEFWARVEAMLVFLAAVTDVGGNVPMIGDSDGCDVLRLSQEPDFSPYRSVLALGSVVLERPALRDEAGAIDDGVLWLCGDSARDVFTGLPSPEQPSGVRREFAEGGYFVLGSDLGTKREVRIVADVGPLGYLSIAAHGHADALAFTLSVSGRELLIDPGTYVYQSKKEWRDHFRGTSAHNTVRVDGRDQSVGGGNLVWTRHARVTRELWETSPSRDRLVGSHDGYARLEDPVIHRRELDYSRPERKLTIRDSLICRASHAVEIGWHFSEECTVASEGLTVVAENGPARIVLRPPTHPGRVTLLSGSESPRVGWVSRDFDVKVPAWAAVWRAEIEGTVELTTEILILPHEEADPPLA